MNRRKSSRFLQPSSMRALVHLVAWLLVAWLAWDYFTGNLTVNPIQAATQRTGKYALVFLVLALSCTPVNTIFGFRQAIAIRRTLGLYAFMFAASHFLMFAGVDFRFDWSLLKLELLEKRYVVVGATALAILFALAVTSFRWWMKRLGKNWKRLHRLVYLASVLVIVHFAWAKKGDVLRLQGDIWQPLAFGALVLLLLALRLPVLRRTVSGLRERVSRSKATLSAPQEQASL